jgi:hypothetical protein
MNGADIMRKAANIGFANLQVTEAQFNCCGAIIKYRTSLDAKEELGGIGMECPYCEGQSEFEPNSWDLDFGPDIEYANQPEGYPDMDMGAIEDQMREKKDEISEEFNDSDYDCEHCGHSSTMGQLAEHDSDTYNEMLNDEMYGQGGVDCPMCGYGEYSDLQDHAHQSSDKAAAQWAEDNMDLRYEGDDHKILAERVKMGQGSIDNPMRGRPTRGQLRARRALQTRGGNNGYDSLREVPFGADLEAAVERYNQKYGPDSLKDSRQPPWGDDDKQGPTMPEIKSPRYDRDKDKLLSGGY